MTEMVKRVMVSGKAGVLVFDSKTGEQIDLSLREATEFTDEPSDTRLVGRPKLGVVAREVTLLPRHWDWLGQQQGGASATLRRLVEQARREDDVEDRVRTGRESLYRFLTAVAGNLPGYEESLRALFAGDAERFVNAIGSLPTDIKEHALQMASPAFAGEPSPMDDVIPFEKRRVVDQALKESFGTAKVGSIERITVGASAAGVFKVEVEGAEYLLRIEGASDGFRDPRRQYVCLRIASDAGLAPQLFYANAEHGIAITAFVPSKPVPASSARREFLSMIANAVKHLHETPLFPVLVDYLDGVGSLIRSCKATGILPAEAMEDFFERYEELSVAYRGAGAELVSSHNDLNSGNVIFSGDRLWLVDWEAAFAADRYVDLAATANFFAKNDEEIEVILETYFGDGLNDFHRARLFLMQQINRTFYAMVMLNYVALANPGARLSPGDLNTTLRWSEARAALNDVSTSETKLRLACVLLREVSRAFGTPRFLEALERMKGNESSRISLGV